MGLRRDLPAAEEAFRSRSCRSAGRITVRLRGGTRGGDGAQVYQQRHHRTKNTEVQAAATESRSRTGKHHPTHLDRVEAAAGLLRGTSTDRATELLVQGPVLIVILT